MTPKCKECDTPVEQTIAKKSFDQYGEVYCLECRRKIDNDEPLPSEADDSAPSAPQEEPDQQTYNVGDGSGDDVPVLNHPESKEAMVEIVDDPHVEVLPALVDADIVRPAISAKAALDAWNEFQNLKGAIINESDVMKIQGKNYVKKSGWRKFATFYNLTDKIVEEIRTPTDAGAFIWKIKVECTAPNGRVTEGVAMCSSTEKSGARIEHDTYATAHTRAKNRAISDMIAAGEVSAEEMR